MVRTREQASAAVKLAAEHPLKASRRLVGAASGLRAIVLRLLGPVTNQLVSEVFPSLGHGGQQVADVGAVGGLCESSRLDSLLSVLRKPVHRGWFVRLQRRQINL